MKKLLFIFAIIIFASCKISKKPNIIKWEIVKESGNKEQSYDSIEVELNKKLKREDLKNVALQVRNARAQFNKVWIF